MQSLLEETINRGMVAGRSQSEPSDNFGLVAGYQSRATRLATQQRPPTDGEEMPRLIPSAMMRLEERQAIVEREARRQLRIDPAQASVSRQEPIREMAEEGEITDVEPGSEMKEDLGRYSTSVANLLGRHVVTRRDWHDSDSE